MAAPLTILSISVVEFVSVCSKANPYDEGYGYPNAGDNENGQPAGWVRPPTEYQSEKCVKGDG